MRATALALALAASILTSTVADAITWTFDQGSTQGWTARERGWSSQQRGPLRWEMDGGVWRVHVNPYSEDIEFGAPTVEFVSPDIDQPLELFDRVELQARLIHPHGIQGVAQVFLDLTAVPGAVADTTVYWDAPDMGSWERASAWDTQLAALDVGERFDDCDWIGAAVLRRIRLVFQLAPPFDGGPRVTGPEDVPAAVEVDWIRLTGMLEQAQGELPPPEWDEQLQGYGYLFESPVYCQLARGTGARSIDMPGGALGDVDGDGALDLVAVTEDNTGRGWLLALNDGDGGFELAYQSPYERPAPRVTLVDVLGGDGAHEVVYHHRSTDVELLSWKDGEWHEESARKDLWLIGSGDTNSDGRLDLCALDLSAAGTGTFRLSLALARGGDDPLWQTRDLEPAVAGARPAALVSRVGTRGVAGALWFAPLQHKLANDGFPWYVVMYQNGDGTIVQERLIYPGPWPSVRHVGDIDGDSDADMVVTTDQVEVDSWPIDAGLSIAQNPGDGDLRLLEWRPQARLRQTYVSVADLSNDGLLDLAYVHFDRAGSAVMVNLGQPDGALPVQEGVYPIAGRGGDILPGDVDNDGDVDLVVLEPQRYGTGGVYVFKNTGLGQSTVVAEGDKHPMPGQFRVGPNYPNPFNAGTTVPLHLERRSAVSLSIYNVTGQRLRTLELGTLDAGVHQVRWDGQNATGNAVPSGVYFVRCTSDAGTVGVGRMVRVE